MNKNAFFILSVIVIWTNADENKDTSPYPDGNPGKNSPGVSACYYDGGVKQKDCKKDPMSRHELPNECTSMFMYGFEVYIVSDHIITTDYTYDSKYKFLKDFKDEGRITYIYYGHLNLEDWIEALNTNGKYANIELENLQKDILPNTTIKGLVLSNIYDKETCFPEKFTTNLITYINIMKKACAGFQIAMCLYATNIMNQADCHGKGESLDFQALDKVIDFYTIDFNYFNKCTDQYIKTGIIPMNGPGNNLENFLKKLKTLNIPKNKIHYEFLISPTVPDSSEIDYAVCFERYTKICENKVEGIDKWCADTTSSLREKGKFAKENGAGFIAFRIDASDRNKACNCYDNKYPTFFFMLDGWYDMNKDKTCPLIDRIFK